MPDSNTVIIVGAGIYGVTAALELRRRGCLVDLLDPGPLPHPLAASTDISKVIRLDYGPDEDYLAAMETAWDRWLRWNADWPEPLLHCGGVLFTTQEPMAPGGFEHESFRMLVKRGHQPLRLDSSTIRQRFPAWSAHRFADGYYNPLGGYAESGKVVARLLEDARSAGVRLREGQAFDHLLENGSRVGGVMTRQGQRFEANTVVFAGGSWTPHALPWMAASLRSSGMPVFHLKPERPDLFASDVFPVFCADITATGYYGFPLHPSGVVKIANHGDGRQLAPDSPDRVVNDYETGRLRDFLETFLPALAGAPIVYTRVCLYCDTWDGHFWIAPDPEREGLVLATGGSGHAFKFAPLLGEWIADAVEGRTNDFSHKFRWRPEVRPPRSEEAARYQQ